MIRIAHVDDHVIFTEGLELLFKSNPNLGCKIVKSIYTGKDLIDQLAKLKIDLLLLDLNIPDVNGLTLLPDIRDNFSNLRILVLTEYRAPKFVRRALKSGADGYILKSRDLNELHAAIEDVMKGEVYMDNDVSIVTGSDYSSSTFFEDDLTLRFNLTPREIEILNLISQSMTNRKIGEKLYISSQTVSVHRKNLMKKLGVHDTAALVKKALRHHLIADM